MSDVVTMRYDPNFTTDTMRILSDQDFPFVTERNLEFMKNKLYDYSVYGSREQTAKLTKEFQAAKASRNLAKRFDKMLSQKSPSTTLSRQDNSAFTLTRNPAKTRTWQEVLEVFKAVFAEVYEVTIRIEAANNEEPFFDELDF